MFYWYYNRDDDLQSTVWAEVDADKRELKSLYYDDKSYWNHPPPIGVPISLPTPLATNRMPANAPNRPPAKKKPHQRLEFPLPLPR